MGNIHYLEILDFFLGWFGWDISKDDWATRIAAREKAALQPFEAPPEQPPDEAPKKPSEKSPPEKRPKEPPKKRTKFDLPDLIP